MEFLEMTAALTGDPVVFSGELPEERVLRNAPGGYYTPNVEQVEEGTMTISFSPSRPDMEPVPERTFILPAGKDGVAPSLIVFQGTGTGGVSVFTMQIRNPDGVTLSTQWRDGSNGLTPFIGSNGNWFLGARDTGVPARGEGGDSVPVPDYWLSQAEAGASAIRQAMEEAGRDRSAFLFYTDAHWESASAVTNSHNSPALLKYLCKHTPIRKTFFGGDIVDEVSEDRQAMAYLWNWRTALHGLPSHYSIPGECDGGNGLLDDTYIYAFLQAAEEAPGLVRPDTGLGYYLDCPGERTRYLCLDTAGLSDQESQTEFMAEALNSTPAGWHIVALAHIWLQREAGVLGLAPAAAGWLALFDAYNARETGSARIGTAAVDYDFAAAGAKVEFCIGGHIHADNAGYASQRGIPVIVLDCDAHGTLSGLVSEAGTVSEQAVNAVIADYGQRKLKIIRIGRGAGFDVAMT